MRACIKAYGNFGMSYYAAQPESFDRSGCRGVDSVIVLQIWDRRLDPPLLQSFG